jgi:hypothetical protein
MTDMHAIAHRILTHDYPAAKKRAEVAEARIAELEKAARWALDDLREHVADGECAGPHGNAREGACSRCRPAEYLAEALKVQP